MDDTALGGLSQCPPPAGQSGDVDADGEILDALRERLDGVVGDCAPGVSRDGHLRRVLTLCERIHAREPGVRFVDGEPRYSAAWLDGGER